MKLKEFSMATATSKRGGKHSLSIIAVHRKGRVSFTPLICEKLNLKLGDRISFLQDEEDLGEWYIEKSDTGFELKLFNTQSSSLVFQNKITTEALFDSFRVKESSLRFKVMPEPVKHGKRTLYKLAHVPIV